MIRKGLKDKLKEAREIQKKIESLENERLELIKGICKEHNLTCGEWFEVSRDYDYEMTIQGR